MKTAKEKSSKPFKRHKMADTIKKSSILHKLVCNIVAIIMKLKKQQSKKKYQKIFTLSVQIAFVLLLLPPTDSITNLLLHK